MKRKITDLEQKLINDGWCLTIKRYTGKHSEKTCSYEYHKIADLRHDGEKFNQIIKLDQKRAQIVNYGIANVCIDYLNDDELMFVRSLFLSLRLYVERIESLDRSNEPLKPIVPNSELDERQGLQPMTPEQFDELCEEMEKSDGKLH